jgi:hypothetical protein
VHQPIRLWGVRRRIRTLVDEDVGLREQVIDVRCVVVRDDSLAGVVPGCLD